MPRRPVDRPREWPGVRQLSCPCGSSTPKRVVADDEANGVVRPSTGLRTCDDKCACTQHGWGEKRTPFRPTSRTPCRRAAREPPRQHVVATRVSEATRQCRGWHLLCLC